MIKLLSIISIILAIVLFPPAVLAVLSNNAVPGDGTYPIKRSLEDGIYAIASLNPTSKAWFSTAKSDRRYKEVSALITQGKVAKKTLSELVSQTDTAAIQIAQIQDPVQKQQLIEQYSQTIEKYNQGLGELAQTPTNTSPHPTTAPPTPTPAPIATSAPVPTLSIALIPTASPSQSISSSDKQDIQDTIEKLGKIKDKLKQEEKSNLTPKEEKDTINKKSDERDSHPGAGAKSEPAGSVKTKNEK